LRLAPGRGRRHRRGRRVRAEGRLSGRARRDQPPDLHDAHGRPVGHADGRGRATGGPGGDVLRGGEIFDSLNGGGGTDALLGNGGDDLLSDGDTDVWVIDPVPTTVGRRQVRLGVGCGQNAAEDPTPLRCRGVVQLREASGRTRLLVRLDATGRALVARKRVRATTFVRGPLLRSVAWSFDLRR
jgi:hypothetical protein